MREGSGRYRPGDRPEDDFWPDDASGAADGYADDGRYATFGPRGDTPVPGRGPAGPAGSAGAGGGPARGGESRGWRHASGPRGPEADRRPPGGYVGRPAEPGSPGGAMAGVPGAGAAVAGVAMAGTDTGPQGTPGSSGAAPAAGPARPYGRILIFTLLDDRVADFDQLAEQTAEEVRTGEPDTLVYVIHTVPNAPMQRIFYEIYRDRTAFDSHESQPYMRRFVADRRSYVLATNVIELRLKYAKVAPLPSPQAPPPAGPPQRPQPLPPARPQRPYQQDPEPQRPDREWPDRQWPDRQGRDPRHGQDPRQVPSGRRYGGG